MSFRLFGCSLAVRTSLRVFRQLTEGSGTRKQNNAAEFQLPFPSGFLIVPPYRQQVIQGAIEARSFAVFQINHT
jgi:hypothetical protein